ncbi:MAG: hypothetical protein ACXVWW_05820 [Nocardioides sp.]|jgi:hypothetical protein
MSVQTIQTIPGVVQTSVERWRLFLESGTAIVPDGLFAPDAFSDLTFPRWRVQIEGAAALVEGRRSMHPQPGRVRVEKVQGDATGYVMKIEERWEDGGEEWYCREAFLCDLNAAGEISEFSLYCTGDWDTARREEHAQAMTLLRP